MALVLFDLLHFNGKNVMREPWRDRRKRLEDWWRAISCHALPWFR
jgi:ATP-dependent DNA ligase